MLNRLPVLDIEGSPLVNQDEWHVKVDGLVERPITLAIPDISSMDERTMLVYGH